MVDQDQDQDRDRDRDGWATVGRAGCGGPVAGDRPEGAGPPAEPPTPPAPDLLLRAATSDFPSLMSSLMNLLVFSSSASWERSRSRNWGLSRQHSLNSSAGSPMLPAHRAPRTNKKKIK